MDLLRRLLRYDQLLVVKTLSLMLINLKNELWISFILSQPIITDLIGLRIEDDNDELTEHYISFLKSLSIRLDSNQISLFYNKVYSN
jgi:protein CLEC16A